MPSAHSWERDPQDSAEGISAIQGPITAKTLFSAVFNTVADVSTEHATLTLGAVLKCLKCLAGSCCITSVLLVLMHM